jgi:hypothetical protein
LEEKKYKNEYVRQFYHLKTISFPVEGSLCLLRAFYRDRKTFFPFFPGVETPGYQYDAPNGAFFQVKIHSFVFVP